MPIRLKMRVFTAGSTWTLTQTILPLLIPKLNARIVTGHNMNIIIMQEINDTSKDPSKCLIFNDQLFSPDLPGQLVAQKPCANIDLACFLTI